MNFKYSIEGVSATPTRIESMARISFRDTLIKSFRAGMRNNQHEKQRINTLWQTHLPQLTNLIEACLLISSKFNTWLSDTLYENILNNKILSIWSCSFLAFCSHPGVYRLSVSVGYAHSRCLEMLQRNLILLLLLLLLAPRWNTSTNTIDHAHNENNYQHEQWHVSNCLHLQLMNWMGLLCLHLACLAHLAHSSKTISLMLLWRPFRCEGICFWTLISWEMNIRHLMRRLPRVTAQRQDSKPRIVAQTGRIFL